MVWHQITITDHHSIATVALLIGTEGHHRIMAAPMDSQMSQNQTFRVVVTTDQGILAEHIGPIISHAIGDGPRFFAIRI